MGKINIDKTNGFSPIRADRKNDVKKSEVNSAPLEITKAAGEDKLEFSDRASEVGKLVEQIKELPDIREAKVNRLREQIAAGEYNPSNDEIAAAIWKDERS